jgi:hypothetical protein
MSNKRYLPLQEAFARKMGYKKAEHCALAVAAPDTLQEHVSSQITIQIMKALSCIEERIRK